MNFLDFEQPIAELEAKIDELRYVGNDAELNINEEIAKLQKHSQEKTQSIFSSLTPWQISQLARHPNRPYSNDYIPQLFSHFEEIHGDRLFADDPAIICGLAKLDKLNVMFIGQQKGRDIQERIHRNYGMPKPEGYRKAMRAMQLAERFQLPIVSFIDTPGAYPGIDAEERGQSEAIATNLMLMSNLKTPIVSVVIGEGGSGGALGIGVADRLLMLEYSTYSVISPEGCASILWKSASKAEEAAESMGITAKRLQELKLIDRIISEPLGGAHRNKVEMAESLKSVLKEELATLQSDNLLDLVAKRQKRFRNIGEFNS